ncbi:structural maintenance of chromosomes 5 smc5 [Aureobasidium sp. EXF-10728]|nr:structural maintenance of chromosomes 5 smc5 [Aureobasidium sp. EXF-10728]
MPGLVPMRRPREDEDDESDLDASTPSFDKRPRLNGHASQTPLLPRSYENDQNHAAPLTHSPGSIVRVAMKDFVTYTSAEFLPGPSLNMIIGPNGTGKSTLVCAICLGLGAKPEVLGRAKDPSEFVKHGQKEAEIEIELERDPARHRTNPVIKRIIKRDSNNKTFFMIDGRNSTQKAVAELCRSFSIQVDNLCQFLPQDRVVEFAALDPIELLVQTQRAAAPDYMSDWHDQLKTMRNDQRKHQAEQGQQTENLKNLEGRQNMQRGDVERLRERAEQQEKLAALERLRPIPTYNVAKDKYHEAKERWKEANNDLAALRRECEPALDAVNSKEAYVKAIDAVVKRRQRLVARAQDDIRQKVKKQHTASEQHKACDHELDAEKKNVKTHKQERLRIDAQIKSLERQVENEPPTIDVAALNEKIRDISRQQREKIDAARDENAKQDDKVTICNSLDQRIGAAELSLRQLRSKAGQQVNKLNNASPDTAKAWDWIQKNRQQFTGKVFGPAILECSVRDTRFANLIESVLGQADMVCITMTHKEDFNLLQRELLNNQRLSDINLRMLDTPLSHWQKPYFDSELRQLGLNTYILDLLEGPEEILSMLCDNRNIHMYGVAFQELSSQQFEAMMSSRISSWATPTETYNVTRRKEYGDAGTSTRTARIKTARFFTSQPVDTHAEQEYKNTIAELKDERQEVQRQAEAHKATSTRYGLEHQELVAQKKDLEAEKKQAQDARSEWQKLPVRIAGFVSKRDALDERQASYRVRVQQIKDKQDKLALDRAQDALTLVSSVQSLQKLEMDLLQASLAMIEAESDFQILQAHNEEVRQNLEQRERDVGVLVKEKDNLKRIASAALETCQALLQNLSDKESEIYTEYREMNLDEYEAEIDSTKARLEMVHGGNPQILREYEKRAGDIERSKRKLELIENELIELQQNISEVRQKWEPELDQLIGQISDAFSENFAKINCAGQVEVYKENDDFNRWAIQIQVKFRENEQLSVLDSHRQSGGERAVSTIFYLMALQSLARAPFRVVDEINQGMDPRNERMVHSRMVDIACAEHTSQYFLITPKLLPNLTYHPNMKVHCIASGEYMPDDQGKLDFGALAQKALAVYGGL